MSGALAACFGGSSFGLVHLLGQCEGLADDRSSFLADVGTASLAGRPAADWLAFVMSPHQPLERLESSVRFCEGIVKELLWSKRQLLENYASCIYLVVAPLGW